MNTFLFFFQSHLKLITSEKLNGIEQERRFSRYEVIEARKRVFKIFTLAPAFFNIGIKYKTGLFCTTAAKEAT